MNLPTTLQAALEKLYTGLRQEDMIRDAFLISQRYRAQNGSGKRLVTHDTEAVAYAASRMPATFSAVYDALRYALAITGKAPRTLIDAGAGTGAAAWAAVAMLDFESILCLEREEAMLSIGQSLMRSGSSALQNAAWERFDLGTGGMKQRAELVILAYVLNEMAEGSRAAAVQKLWNAVDTMLLIVEPGTPAGYKHLIEARGLLLSMGAHIAAPCPHENECPMADGDWCHFSCRVQRTQLHRRLKGGEAPYEDEKFAYMAFTREPCKQVQARVLRHPQVRTGHVMVTVCGTDGIKTQTVSKKDGSLYKLIRDAHAGDAIGY